MKINRKPKKPDSASKLVLEEVIGLTTKNSNGLASNASTPRCAYVAGCVVVLFDVDSATQCYLMASQTIPRPLNCVAVSSDGRFVAAGETGNQPAVLVWNYSTRALVSELKGLLYGVECIAFSPDGEHLVSVGGYIYIWDWRSGMLVTKLKASSSSSAITSVSFSSDAKFIVTAGKKHLKFWTVTSSPRTRLNKATGSLAMHGKPVNLGPQKGCSFISVASSIPMNKKSVSDKKCGDLFPIYALTVEGVLCLLDSAFSLRKSVDLKVEKGFALSASDKLVACACCNGTVLLFISETLNYAGSLIYSKAKSFQGEIDIVCSTRTTDKDDRLVTILPDAIACQFCTPEKLVVIYGDHSLYVWDIHDMSKATRCYVLVSHSACIWDVKNLCCENMHDPSLACVTRGCSGGVSFATCSADGTIRLWDLALQLDVSEDDADHHSADLEQLTTARLVSSGIFERDSVEAGISTQGFRSMAASFDGKYLAAGDCEGNLHIYDLYTSDYTCFQGVHDAEVLSLSFSSSRKSSVSSKELMDGNFFLASGGRDRIIHLYDVKRNFDLVESITDHSAAVTSVKLTSHDCKILSCSADRSLVFRDVCQTENGLKILRRHHQMASHGTVYDMAMDPTMEFVVTVGQDKKINSFEIASGKQIRSFKQDKDFGDPIKVTMDPSCSFLVCSYSNKSMCLYDFISGEMVAQATGHGEVITGVIFLPDCKHVVSVGGDGCIFVWKLPARISSRILQRMKEFSTPFSPKNLGLPVAFSQFMLSQKEDQHCSINPENFLMLENSNKFRQNAMYQDFRNTTNFRFSISRLPNWAQAKVANPNSVIMNTDFTSSQQIQQAELKVLSPMIDDVEESGPLCSEVQSPILNMEGSDSCLNSLSRVSPDNSDSQSPPLPQNTNGCFAMDKRWLNVYNVCQDVLNSPEADHLMDLNMQFSSSSLLQNPTEVQNGVFCSYGQADHLVDDRPGVASKLNAFLNNYGVPCENNACYKSVEGDVAEQLHSCKSGSQIPETLEVDAHHPKSEDSDLFRQHFATLSTVDKMETSNSSLRRKFSGRFIIRQDYRGGCKRLFETPIRDSGGKTLNCKGGTTLSNNSDSSENPKMHCLDEQQQIDYSNQDYQKNLIQNLPVSSCLSQGDSSKYPLTENSINIEITQPAVQEESNPEGSDLLQRVAACKEALLNLDAAAEKAFHSFSELGTLALSEDSGGPGTKLYDDAGRLLPKIAEKFNAIAERVKCSNISWCRRSTDEVSGFEPLLGTIAENLSEKVVEILKKNLIKD